MLHSAAYITKRKVKFEPDLQIDPKSFSKFLDKLQNAEILKISAF